MEPLRRARVRRDRDGGAAARGGSHHKENRALIMTNTATPSYEEGIKRKPLDRESAEALMGRTM